MPRLLITDPIPVPPREISQGTTVIAPPLVGGALAGIRTRSLHDHGKFLLRKVDITVASPLISMRTLGAAVRRVVGPVNTDASPGYYRETVAEILRSGVDIDRLIAVDSRRAQDTGRIASEYESLLAKRRLVDSDAVLSTALKQDLVQPSKAVVYGYFRARYLPARPEEIEFIDRLAGEGSVFYLPCGDGSIFSANHQWVELLLSRGWEVAPSDAPGEVIPSEIADLARGFATGAGEPQSTFEAIEYRNIEAEVRGTLARVKAAALNGVGPADIAIVCRDLDLYTPLLISTAREYRLPITIDLKAPLARTAFGEFVSLLFETVGGANSASVNFAYEPTLRLVSHRFGPTLVDGQRSKAYQTRPSGADAWCEIAPELKCLSNDGKCTATAWIAWLKDVFAQWELTPDQKLGASPLDAAAHDLFFEALDDIAIESGDREISITEFSRDLSEVLTNLRSPAHSEPCGVKLLMPNEVVGARFDRIFVIGMAEGILPAPSGDSSVLDFCERKRLAQHGIYLEDALEVPRWEALTFYFTLLAGRSSVVFSYPKFAAVTEMLPSAYFLRMGVSPAPIDDQFVSSVEEYRRAYLNELKDDDAVMTAARHQYAVESRRESDRPCDEYDGVIGISVARETWSASSLSRVGSCAFKWFAHDVLKLGGLDEADAELRGDMRGRLMHKTLELAAKRAKTASDIRTAILEILEEEFANAETLEPALTMVSNWELRRHEQIEKLRVAIASNEFVGDDAAIIDTEKRFRVNAFGLTLTGSIDRVDRHADGKVVAIDYKSGAYISRVKDDDGYLAVDIQLPIYSQVAVRNLYPDAAIAAGQFFHLSTQKITRGKETDLERFLARVRSIVETGSFAVEPDVQHKACEFCEYDIVCRTGPRLMRKRTQ